jgi:CrcB protein
MTVLLLGLAGGVGAVARFMVDGLIRARLKTALPWGTILINVSGSLVLGFLAGLMMRDEASETLYLVLGTGFLGGYTTFSTASLETIRLIQSGRAGLALINGVGSMAACVLAAAAGIGLTFLLP